MVVRRCRRVYPVSGVGVAAERAPLGSLDLRGLRARVEDVDGDPVLLVDDGDVEIEFSSGIGGTWDQAIAGAERLAATAAAYAAELRRRRPNARHETSRS
jgi:hypothetical protein